MGIEVIGAGYPRTGTSSFKAAMEILGYGKCYHMREVFDNGHAPCWTEICKEGNLELIRDLMEKNGYRSSADMPSCLFWHEQLQIYPDAKVIVTVRDPVKWYQSWSTTIALMQPDSESCVFGTRILAGLGIGAFLGVNDMFHEVITRKAFNGDISKQNMIKTYNEHLESVIKLCPPKQLLLFNAVDGWEPLCTFLGVPVPDVPYPNINDALHFQRVAYFLNIVGWVVTIFGLGIPSLYRSQSRVTDPSKMSTNLGGQDD